MSKMKKTNRECVLGKCGGHYFFFPLGEESVGLGHFCVPSLTG